jgi:hypothetical protein
MQNQLKFLGILLLLLGFSPLLSQDLGVKIGLNLTNIKIKDNEIYENRINPTFQGGLLADFRISEQYSIETGLNFSSKGYQLSYIGNTSSNIKIHQKFVLNYLELPLSLKYGIKVGETKIYGQFGQYLGLGLFGKVKYLIVDGLDFERWKDDLNWGSNKYPYQKLDFGLIAGFGFETGPIQVGLTYTYGLSNILLSSLVNNQLKISNRVIGLSVGYLFGRN